MFFLVEVAMEIWVGFLVRKVCRERYVCGVCFNVR